MRTCYLAPVLLPLALCLSLPTQAQDPPPVPIEVVPVAEGVTMLVGRGGNLGLGTGPDGAFLIDDQYAPMTPEIRKALERLGVGNPRFVLNTHWHGDHTGGNEAFGTAGALLVAHDGVRRRMSSEQLIALFDLEVPPSPPGALPVVTFTDEVTFHLNGDTIHAIHVPAAHTDGDAFVHFERADVIHAGDLVWIGGYPFVDLSSGGSVDGTIAAGERILQLATPQTRIIPGHGPLAGPEEVQAYLAMLRGIRERVAELAAAGKTRAEVIAAKPTAPWDEAWGRGHIAPDVFAGVVYDSLAANAP